MAADRRVVVTGAAAISPLGHDWPTIEAHLRTCAAAAMPCARCPNGMSTLA